MLDVQEGLGRGGADPLCVGGIGVADGDGEDLLVARPLHADHAAQLVGAQGLAALLDGEAEDTIAVDEPQHTFVAHPRQDTRDPGLALGLSELHAGYLGAGDVVGLEEDGDRDESDERGDEGDETDEAPADEQPPDDAHQVELFHLREEPLVHEAALGLRASRGRARGGRRRRRDLDLGDPAALVSSIRTVLAHPFAPSARSTAMVRSAQRRHVNPAARAGPASRSRSLNATSRTILSSPALSGASDRQSTSSPASPTTSGKEAASEASTGTPQAIAVERWQAETLEEGGEDHRVGPPEQGRQDRVVDEARVHDGAATVGDGGADDLRTSPVGPDEHELVGQAQASTQADEAPNEPRVVLRRMLQPCWI